MKAGLVTQKSSGGVLRALGFYAGRSTDQTRRRSLLAVLLAYMR